LDEIELVINTAVEQHKVSVVKFMDFSAMSATTFQELQPSAEVSRRLMTFVRTLRILIIINSNLNSLGSEHFGRRMFVIIQMRFKPGEDHGNSEGI